MDRIAPDADFVIYNETYRILVCERCQIGIRSLNTHLLKTHGAELSLRRRNAIVDRFAGRPLLDPKTATPADLSYPHSAPVPNVQIHRNDFACNACPKVYCGDKLIARHCKRKHGS